MPLKNFRDTNVTGMQTHGFVCFFRGISLFESFRDATTNINVAVFSTNVKIECYGFHVACITELCNRLCNNQTLYLVVSC